MAIYHMATKAIGRASGRSATASSAYRAGVEIKDERTGLNHNYSKRSGVLTAKAFDKDGNELNRNELWNKAELAETRKNGRTAREYIIAIPHELMQKDGKNNQDLSKSVGIKVAFEYGKKIAERYDVGVDVAVHSPDAKGDNRNYHAHILTTTRKLEQTRDGYVLTDKADIELSNTQLKERDLPKTQEQIKELRQLWADTANHYLDKENKIDHRSYKEQGIDKKPTIKLGWKESQLERLGIKTVRGNVNRVITADNEKIKRLGTEIYLDRGRLGVESSVQKIKDNHVDRITQDINQRRGMARKVRPNLSPSDENLSLVEKNEVWKAEQMEIKRSKQMQQRYEQEYSRSIDIEQEL